MWIKKFWYGDFNDDNDDYPKLANSDKKNSNHCVFKQTFIEMFRKLLQILKWININPCPTVKSGNAVSIFYTKKISNGTLNYTSKQARCVSKKSGQTYRNRTKFLFIFSFSRIQ